MSNSTKILGWMLFKLNMSALKSTYSELLKTAFPHVCCRLESNHCMQEPKLDLKQIP